MEGSPIDDYLAILDALADMAGKCRETKRLGDNDLGRHRCMKLEGHDGPHDYACSVCGPDHPQRFEARKEN